MPKTNDPKYVRLASRLSRRIVADVMVSGWSISGLDVQKFPEDKNAAKFVRKLLGDGILEPASHAEYEEVIDSAVTVDTNQEAQVKEESLASHQSRLDARESAGEDEDGEDDEEEPEEEEDASEGDDEEEETPPPAPKKKTSAKKKAGKKSKK